MKIKYAVVYGLMGFVLAGCVTGASAPVVRSYTPHSVDSKQAYETAVRALHEIGRIEHENKERGFILGKARSGVSLDIEVASEAGRAKTITVRGSIPPGKLGFGTIDEPDTFLAIYQRLEAAGQR